MGQAREESNRFDEICLVVGFVLVYPRNVSLVGLQV